MGPVSWSTVTSSRASRPWTVNHTWYEQPQGAGVSEAAVAKGEGRNGGDCMKITGGGKRGIVLQELPAYVGRYRVSGWIKCEDLEGASAQILVEWQDKGDKWMRGDSVGSVTGTQDWQRFEAIVEPTKGTWRVHFDLLVTAPNNGTAWFDDLEFERIQSGLPATVAPAITAETPAGEDACLQVSWDPAKLSEGTVRLLVYCEEKPIGDGKAMLPRAVLDADEGKGVIRSLGNGKKHYVAAVAINGDDKSSPLGAAVEATPTDKQAPRAGWSSGREDAGRSGRGRVVAARARLRREDRAHRGARCGRTTGRRFSDRHGRRDA